MGGENVLRLPPIKLKLNDNFDELQRRKSKRVRFKFMGNFDKNAVAEDLAVPAIKTVLRAFSFLCYGMFTALFRFVSKFSITYNFMSAKARRKYNILNIDRKSDV